MSVAPRTSRTEGGFTLVELAAVVGVLGILAGIAVSNLATARVRAQDRAAQATVRSAQVAQVSVHTEQHRFTDTVPELAAVEPGLRYTPSVAALTSDGVAYVELLPDSYRPQDTVLLGARSASGTCFWLRVTAGGVAPLHATNDCAAAPASSAFRSGGW